VGIAIHVGEGPEDFWSGFSSSAHRPDQLEGTMDWTEYEFAFTTLDSTHTIRISAQIRRASGAAWFDDLELIPADQ
jgi:hypothetical protein